MKYEGTKIHREIMEDGPYRPSVIATTLPSYEKHYICFKLFGFRYKVSKEKCVGLKCTH